MLDAAAARSSAIAHRASLIANSVHDGAKFSAAAKAEKAPDTPRERGRRRSAFALGDSGDLKSGPIKDGPGRQHFRHESRSSLVDGLKAMNSAKELPVPGDEVEGEPLALLAALQKRVRMKAAGMAVLASMPRRKTLPAPVGGASLSSDSAQESDAPEAVMPGRKTLPAPAAAAADDDDDAPWQRHVAKDGRTYLYNAATRESKWEAPPAAAAAPSEDEWQQTKDGRGRTYYYNRRTKETSWMLPSSSAQRGEGGELEA